MTSERKTDFLSGYRLGRRALMRSSLLGGLGVATAALIGCGGDDEEGDEPGGTETSSSTGTQAAGAGELIKDDSLPYPYQFQSRAHSRSRAASWSSA